MSALPDLSSPVLDRQSEYQPPEQMPAKVLTVLEATIRMLGGRSMSEFSIDRVSRASGVSRATIYRYFSTKDDLLQAVSEFICQAYESGVIGAGAGQTPMGRFAKVMEFMARFTEERGLLRMFEADASFHLNFFRTHYARHRAAVMAALAPSFDYLESRDGIVINREVTAGRLVRLQLSRLIVPLEPSLAGAWENAAEKIEDWIVTQSAEQQPI